MRKKPVNKLFASLGSVRIVKNGDFGHSFLLYGTSQPANKIYFTCLSSFPPQFAFCAVQISEGLIRNISMNMNIANNFPPPTDSQDRHEPVVTNT